MTFEEILESRKRSAVAIFHRFRLRSSEKQISSIFVEGYEDLQYYSLVAKGTKYESAYFIITYGKYNMDRIIQWFYAEGYENTSTLFVRDSDFDGFLGTLPTGNHIYVTKGYSVENYIYSQATIRNFLVERLCVSKDEVNVDDISASFSANVALLFDWMSPFFGAAIAAASGGRRLDLDKFDISYYFKLLVESKPLPDITSLDYLPIGLSPTDFTNESETLGKRYTGQQADWWMRGHYLSICASEFLRYIHAMLGTQKKTKTIDQLNVSASNDYSVKALFERSIGLVTLDPDLAVAFN